MPQSLFTHLRRYFNALFATFSVTSEPLRKLIPAVVARYDCRSMSVCVAASSVRSQPQGRRGFLTGCRRRSVTRLATPETAFSEQDRLFRLASSILRFASSRAKLAGSETRALLLTSNVRSEARSPMCSGSRVSPFPASVRCCKDLSMPIHGGSDESAPRGDSRSRRRCNFLQRQSQGSTE